MCRTAGGAGACARSGAEREIAMSKTLRGSVLLTLTALIWGCAFVAQSTAMDHVGPFSYQAVRSFIAGAALLSASFLQNAVRRKRGVYTKPSREDLRRLAAGGLVCGTALGIASNLQQLGIKFTTAGKAGFITAMYIIFVPLLGLLLFHRKPPLNVWAGVAAAVVGLYLLCGGGLSVSAGDLCVLACSLGFAVHIICCGHFAEGCDCIALSGLQFIVCGTVSSVLVLVFEADGLSSLAGGLYDARFSVLYAGVVSSGVGYTLQLLGQRDVSPTVSSLLMSLESVFAAAAGVLLLNESLSAAELAGCALMLAAVVTAQLPKGAFAALKKRNSVVRRSGGSSSS